MQSSQQGHALLRTPPRRRDNRDRYLEDEAEVRRTVFRGRAMEALSNALALDNEEETMSDAQAEHAAGLYREAVRALRGVLSVEVDQSKRIDLEAQMAGFEGRASDLESGDVKRRDRKVIKIPGYSGALYGGLKKVNPFQRLKSPEAVSQPRRRSMHVTPPASPLTSPVGSTPNSPSGSTMSTRRGNRRHPSESDVEKGILVEQTSANNLCCCGALTRSKVISMYDLCIKPIKKEYPSWLPVISWLLMVMQFAVISAYLYENMYSCVPPDASYSTAVRWGIPLCCIYAAADSLKDIFRFLPLILYQNDNAVHWKAVAMSVCVIVIALYQMVVIGINLSQTTDIITLISDFVGVTIVTKSDELIADILQLDDEDPNFLNNLLVRSKLKEMVQAESPEDGETVKQTVKQKSAYHKRHMCMRILIAIGRSYKNPVKRLAWILVGALGISAITFAGQYGAEYFCRGYEGA